MISETTVVRNARMLSKTGTDLSDIRIEKGRIAEIGRIASVPDASDIDAGGRTILPGLIDIHIQGAGGSDVLDGTVEGLQTISHTLARFGVTGFLATTFYNMDGNNEHLRLAAEYCGKDLGGAKLLGIHIEGPFISQAKRGGIPEKCITTPSDDVMEKIAGMCGSALRIMTIAPEIPGNDKMIRRLQDIGCIPAFGHSNATYQETLKAFDLGISHVTHLFNAMPGMSHREPGPLLAIFENPAVTVQLIVDGVHIHPGMIRLVHRIIGSERIICITDGIQAIGLPDGRYIFHGRDYESKNGSARYLDGTLIGTAIALNKMVSNYSEFTGSGLENVIKTGSENPSKLLGMSGETGILSLNVSADFSIVDDGGEVYMTFINGRCVYNSREAN